MIKAIAFDFVGVFLQENDFELDEVDQQLESKFGVINNDLDFLKWAVSETALTEAEVIAKVRHIIQNIYEIREPTLFDKLPKLKFSTATNHLSYLDEWFKPLPIGAKFQYFVNSALVGAQKPEGRFFDILSSTLGEPSECILFIDDNEINCNAAKNKGFKVIHYKRQNLLSTEILNVLSSDLER